MRKILAIIILISLCAQQIAHIGIVGYYQINKDFIAKNLCENRDKPQMKCCGKCYLQKQLKKIDNDTQEKGTPEKVEKSELLCFILPASILVSLKYTFDIAVQNPSRQRLYNKDLSRSTFHPPPLTHIGLV